MHSADRHKVCFDINGRPAIVRAIDTYKSCGIDQHVLVVGALAGQVVETVGKHHPGSDLRLPGRATRHRARDEAGRGRPRGAALRGRGAGRGRRQAARCPGGRATDRRIPVDGRRHGVPGRRAPAARSWATSCATRTARWWGSSSTRTCWHGKPLAGSAIWRWLPLRDPRAMALSWPRRWPRSCAPPSRMPAKPSWPSASCGSRVAASPPITREEILALAPEERTVFHLGNARHPHLTLTPEEVARSQEVNQSVYLVRAPALFYALDRLRPDNAQREEYLSDIVSILAQVHDHGRQHYRVRCPDRDRSQPGDGLQQPGRAAGDREHAASEGGGGRASGSSTLGRELPDGAASG